MKHLICPRCGSSSVRRSSRRGASERVLSAVYVYPFRCEPCQYRFFRLRWGERYDRVALSERRQAFRVPAEFWATLWIDGLPSTARLMDLSARGCALASTASIAPGRELRLRLDPGPGRPPILVDMAVVRSVQTGRLGLQFVRVEAAAAAELRQLVDELARQQRSPGS